MAMNEKARKPLLRVITVAGGILGFVLFRWTPTTGKGFLIYGVLVAILIGMLIALPPRKDSGSEDH
jgi:hypothetical protein